MLQPVTIRCWAVFVLRNPSDLQHSGPGSLDAFLRCVVQGFTAMGMKMPAQPDLVDKVGDMGRYPEQGRLDQAVTNAMKKLQAKNKRLDVAFFIIPRKGAHLPRTPPPLPQHAHLPAHQLPGPRRHQQSTSILCHATRACRRRFCIGTRRPVVTSCAR